MVSLSRGPIILLGIQFVTLVTLVIGNAFVLMVGVVIRSWCMIFSQFIILYHVRCIALNHAGTTEVVVP